MSIIHPLLFTQSNSQRKWNGSSFALWTLRMIFKIAVFLLEKKVKAETNNQKKSNFLSVKGSFVKVPSVLQISPNWECSESCQTRLGWMACWTWGWNNPVGNRWGQYCSLPDSAFPANPEPWCGQSLSSHTQKYLFVLVESPIFWIIPQTTPCQFHILWATDCAICGLLNKMWIEDKLSFKHSSQKCVNPWVFHFDFLSFSLSLFKWKNLNYTNGEKTYSPASTVDNSWPSLFSLFC